MGGPGETQIETDRRLIADRIRKLKAELGEVRRTRTLQRSARKRVPYPTVALVGYTNAGKSTLFNRLTQSEVDRKSVVVGQSVSVRVDLGGRRVIKQKTHKSTQIRMTRNTNNIINYVLSKTR